MGEDDNDRSDGVREDDAGGAQNVPVYHPAVHFSAGLRAALRNTHGLYEHCQEQHKLGENVGHDKRRDEKRRSSTNEKCGR